MFDNQNYEIVTEFTEVKQLREHMLLHGHLFFYINDRYYFLSGSHKVNEEGKRIPWWYIANGDVDTEFITVESEHSAMASVIGS